MDEVQGKPDRLSAARHVRLTLDRWRYKALPHRFYTYTNGSILQLDDWDETGVWWLGRTWFKRVR